MIRKLQNFSTQIWWFLHCQARRAVADRHLPHAKLRTYARSCYAKMIKNCPLPPQTPPARKSDFSFCFTVISTLIPLQVSNTVGFLIFQNTKLNAKHPASWRCSSLTYFGRNSKLYPSVLQRGTAARDLPPTATHCHTTPTHVLYHALPLRAISTSRARTNI